MQLEIDFLQFQPQLRLQQAEGKNYVFDPVRKKLILLTPEELLRQLVVHFLLVDMKYPIQKIRVEIGIMLHGMKRRCDIVVFDDSIKPWLLVECKSPKVRISQNTFEQAAAYNLQLQVPFLAVTNGLSTFCCAIDHEARNFKFLEQFPEWI
ncbi:MAG: type I restriction enzyme HsdR N-terminal domain-containing protein [Lewinellaceae bacterium]|nr:type I restriction enzyme HsdR N-terminal domain-containing protein [Lewinellaceae bacterium]